MDPLISAWLSGIVLGVAGTLVADRLVLVPIVDVWRRFLRHRAIDAWARLHPRRRRGHR